MFNGYLTFVFSILMIGLVTAVIGDVAGHLGCFIFLKDSVNAIAFVALGTSVPGKVHFIKTSYIFCRSIKSLSARRNCFGWNSRKILCETTILNQMWS